MARPSTNAAKEIHFSAKLLRPKAMADGSGEHSSSSPWTFVILPKQASDTLSSRGQVTVEGTINGEPLLATLQPDGQGGHWLKVDRKLQSAAGAKAGDVVEFRFAPVPPQREPEPDVPDDLRSALSGAAKAAQETWSDITPRARRDWIHWIESAKQTSTRVRRINNTCDMLGTGKRRPCCFDRSGMYSKSMSCPVAEEE